ncbi:AAA family ATPase [Belliella sp. DSM 111904]|uniref:AAA family ATPase n=1 Tax=Belliella filtrata TaxID=2923435 RepID=A0ABS9UXQ7_9BACT|nr:AAA family ATPase [Belliella filtrata]MCH7408948.1 AAA family ATPase [Belliella filtrata]
MIYVERNIIPVPEVFYSKEVEIAKKRLEEFYLKSKESRSQQKYSQPFEKELRDKFLEALREVFKEKCAYCESPISFNRVQSEYDHFRPKGGARGLDKEFSTDHYWWLTYDWNNIYLSCSHCNQYKSTWFPVEGKRIPLNTPYKEVIYHEKALLIDPCIDKPEEHLIFNEQGGIEAISPKGATTIEILKLDRSELVNARLEVLKVLYGEWELLLKLLKKEESNRENIKKLYSAWQYKYTIHSEESYLGIQRFMLSKWLGNRPEIQEYFFSIAGHKTRNKEIRLIKNFSILKSETFTETEKYNFEQSISSIKHVYVEKIELKNFKCFSSLAIEFNHNSDSPIENEPWLLFLGENGVGKSSLLKAFVIGLTGDEYIKSLELEGKDLLKHGARSGFIRIHLVGAIRPIEVTFNKTEIKTTLYQPIVNIVAYNSIRLKPKEGKIQPEKGDFYGAKAKNLFDYTFSLIDADSWLVKLFKKDKDAFDRVAISLKDLMLLENDDTISIVKNQPVIKRNGDVFLIDELSDGYRSIFYLAVDIMATLAGENVTFDLAEGMVLIDEIGTHLHPRWRMEVVTRLRKAFPKIRFVVTTHEPLCLRGLRAGETVVLTKNQENEVIALTELPDPSELRVDQILTSDFFGLKSTIDPETERLFDEYYVILALEEKDRSEEQKNRLLDLSQIIPRIKHLGDTEREELTYYVIDELLARKTREDGLKIKKDLEKEALKRVESIWKTLDIKK